MREHASSGRATMAMIAVGALLLSLVPGHAHAQTAGVGATRGLDAVSFKPALGFDAFLVLEGLEPTPAGRILLTAGFDLAEGLMALKVGQAKVGNLLKRQLTLRLSTSYAVTHRLEVSAELPLLLFQANAFDLLRDKLGFNDSPPARTGTGDLRLLGRYHLWARSDRPIGLAASLELRGLTGESESFFGERGVAIIPAIEAEFDPFEMLRLVARVGYLFRSRPGRYLNLYQGDEFLLAVGGAYRLPSLLGFKPEALAELLIASPSRAPFTFAAADALKTPMEFFVGLRGTIHDRLDLRVGFGRGLTVRSGFGREAFRIFALLRYQGEVSPGPARPPCDIDRDGLPDAYDACPTLPGHADLDGCPDTDGDEIPDPDDACPRLAGPATREGCPVEGALALYQTGHIVLLGAIRFDTGAATLKPGSSPILDAVGTIMIEHPELAQIRVDGYTDDRGPAAFNLELSRRRAETVVSYLIGRKVEATRLFPRGFGEEAPVADNTTPIGRARNRRVVFTVLQKTKPGSHEVEPEP